MDVESSWTTTRERPRTRMSDVVDECWKRVFAEVEGAVVYIDYAAAECLHWYTAGRGYLGLKAAGAIAVQELAMYNFRYIEIKECKRAVIVSTSNEPAFYRRTIKMIVAKNAYESCTILCAARSTSSDRQSAIVSHERKIDYGKLKRDVKEWMATSKRIAQEPTVNVVHVPIFAAVINDDLLVTPAFGELMPSLDSEIAEEPSDRADYLAQSLHDFIGRSAASRDVYAIGRLSDRIAEKMESLEGTATGSDRSKNSANVNASAAATSVSLIIVDRTLDLCTPTSNSTESFLGNILRTLPRLPHHENDVAIDMSPICGELKGVSRAYKIPGCLASLGRTTMESLITKKSRKVLDTAHRSLTEILSSSLVRESPRPRSVSRVTGHALQKFVAKLREANLFDSISADSREKLEMILAVVEASTSEKTGQLELLTSLEKLALQNLSVSRESSSILAQLSSIVRTRTARGLDIENLLALLIHIYALAGTEIRFSSQQEAALEESIGDAVFEDMKRFNENPPSGATTIYQRTLLLSGATDLAVPTDASKKIAPQIMKVLRAVAMQRSSLQDYRSLMTKPAVGDETAVRCVGILEQLITHVLRTDTLQELRDLRQRSSSSSSLVTTGFNLFARGRTKRHPRENPWLFVYVVGGVTPEEAKTVKEAVATYRPELHVTLAGSRLLNPLDIADKILWLSMNQ